LNPEEINKSVYTFVYDDEKRLIIAVAYLIMIVLGLGFVLLNQWVTIVFGVLLVAVGLFKLLDICFFKRLTIGNTRITKEWFYFGKRSIDLSDLQAGVAKQLWSGTIFFQHKNHFGIDKLIMQFEVFPIGNSKFRLIRQILIQKGIISGDELSWNY